MIRNLLFDWSGTLADDLDNVLQAVNGMLGAHDLPALEREAFRARFRLPYTEFFAEMLPGVALSELQRLYLDHFPHAHEGVTILPHAAEMLRAASSAGLRLAVLSSAPESHVLAQAIALGVRDHFEVLRCGVIDKRAEICALLDQLDMLPQQTAFIGDMGHDMEAGKTAGVITIATCTGYESASRLMASQPDFLVPDLSRLPALLGLDHSALSEMPVCTVGALIVNHREEILLIQTHKWSHLWGMPGGKIKRGETCEQALIREIQEETGLHLRSIQQVMLHDCIEPPEFQRSAHFLLVSHIARCADEAPTVVLNEEAQSFQWIRPSEALACRLNAPTRALLAECIRLGLLR